MRSGRCSGWWVWTGRVTKVGGVGLGWKVSIESWERVLTVGEECMVPCEGGGEGLNCVCVVVGWMESWWRVGGGRRVERGGRGRK